MTLPPKLNRAFKSQSKIICLKDSATKEKEKVNRVYKKHMGNLKHETDFLELKKTFKFKYSLGKWKIITIKNEFNILEVERGKTSTQNKTAEEEFMRKGVKDLTNISRRSNMGRCLRERK